MGVAVASGVSDRAGCLKGCRPCHGRRLAGPAGWPSTTFFVRQAQPARWVVPRRRPADDEALTLLQPLGQPLPGFDLGDLGDRSRSQQSKPGRLRAPATDAGARPGEPGPDFGGARIRCISLNVAKGLLRKRRAAAGIGPPLPTAAMLLCQRMNGIGAVPVPAAANRLVRSAGRNSARQAIPPNKQAVPPNKNALQERNLLSCPVVPPGNHAPRHGRPGIREYGTDSREYGTDRLSGTPARGSSACGDSGQNAPPWRVVVARNRERLLRDGTGSSPSGSPARSTIATRTSVPAKPAPPPFAGRWPWRCAFGTDRRGSDGRAGFGWNRPARFCLAGGSWTAGQPGTMPMPAMLQARPCGITAPIAWTVWKLLRAAVRIGTGDRSMIGTACSALAESRSCPSAGSPPKDMDR